MYRDLVDGQGFGGAHLDPHRLRPQHGIDFLEGVDRHLADDADRGLGIAEQQHPVALGAVERQFPDAGQHAVLQLGPDHQVIHLLGFFHLGRGGLLLEIFPTELVDVFPVDVALGHVGIGAEPIADGFGVGAELDRIAGGLGQVAADDQQVALGHVDLLAVLVGVAVGNHPVFGMGLVVDDDDTSDLGHRWDPGLAFILEAGGAVLALPEDADAPAALAVALGQIVGPVGPGADQRPAHGVLVFAVLGLGIFVRGLGVLVFAVLGLGVLGLGVLGLGVLGFGVLVLGILEREVEGDPVEIGDAALLDRLSFADFTEPGMDAAEVGRHQQAFALGLGLGLVAAPG